MSATRKWAVVGSIAAISTIGIGTAAYAAPTLNDPTPATPAAPGDKSADSPS